MDIFTLIILWVVIGILVGKYRWELAYGVDFKNLKLGDRFLLSINWPVTYVVCGPDISWFIRHPKKPSLAFDCFSDEDAFIKTFETKYGYCAAMMFWGFPCFIFSTTVFVLGCILRIMYEMLVPVYKICMWCIKCII
ncbi:hypothetical protein ACFL0K_00220 [Patescibacteria group bacterium]